MKDKVLIIGGYGEVGDKVASLLYPKHSYNLVIAGRNLGKATTLATQLGEGVEACAIDLSLETGFGDVLSNVKMVIMCIDCKNTLFLENCWAENIVYLDITASYNVIQQLESMSESVKAMGSTVLCSVGVAPGLTNLAAKLCLEENQEASDIDIVIMLGLGEKHGLAAIEWTLSQMNKDFTLFSGKGKKSVRNFDDPKTFYFPFNLGSNVAYRYNFSDQHTLLKTLSVENIETRMCFDSPTVSHLYHLLVKTKLSVLFNVYWIRRFVAKILRRFQFGHELFCVYVQASSSNKVVSYALYGKKEAEATAIVAATAAEKLLKMSVPVGVFHIEQLFDTKEFISAAGELGLKIKSELNYFDQDKA